MGKRNRQRLAQDDLSIPAGSDELTGDLPRSAGQRESNPPVPQSAAKSAQADAVPPPAPPQPARRRRAMRLALGLTLLTVLGLAVAPTLITRTRLRDWLVQRATTQLAGEVRIGAVRVGWLSPTRLVELKVCDRRGQAWLQVAEATWDRSLWQLLTRPTQLGTLTIKQPVLQCEVRTGGSNVEDFLAPLLVPQSTSGPDRTIRIDVRDGRIELRSTTTDIAVTLETVSAQLEVGGKVAGQVTGELQIAAIHGAGARSEAGNWQLSGTWRAAEPNATPQVSLQTQFAELPLDLVALAAERMSYRIESGGTATGELRVTTTLAAGRPFESVAAKFELRSAQFKTAAIAPDSLQLDTATVELALATRGQLCQVETARLRSNLGEIQASGELDLARLGAAQGNPWAELATHVWEVRATADLAQLAHQLPRTLGLRDDIRLAAGTIAGELTNDISQTAPRLSGRFQTHDLQANQGDKQVSLRSPVEVQFTAVPATAGWTLEQLHSQSSFLELTAQGSLQQGRLQVKTNFDELQRELGQFFDFHGYSLAGRCQAELDWQVPTAGAWELHAQGQAASLQLTHPARRAWAESKLAVDLKARGQSLGAQLTTLDQCQIAVTGDERSDQLNVELAEPIEQVGWRADWPLRASVSGDLARWQTRLQWVTASTLPDISGQVSAQADAILSPTRIDISGAEATLRNVSVSWADGGSLQEPALQLKAQGSYSLADGQIKCQLATLASTVVSMRAEQLAWPPSQVPNQNGQINYRGDLGKLWQRLYPRELNRPAGQVQGRLQFVPSPTGLAFRTSQQVTDFRWQAVDPRRPGPSYEVWHEPEIRLSADGNWHAGADRLELTTASLDAALGGLTVRGEIQELSGRMAAQLQGRTRVDLGQLNQRMRPWLGTDVQLRGETDEPFQLAGPLRSRSNSSADTTTQFTSKVDRAADAALVSAQLRGDAALRWQELQAWGFSAGETQVTAHLAEQVVTCDPIQLPMNGGQLRLAPQVRLQSPYVLTLGPGVLADQVEITQEMCHGWMKYVAPLVADATSARGRFSIKLARAEVPLLMPEQATVEGSISIHQAQVGPGPLARELLTLAQQIQTFVKPQSSGRLSGEAAWIELPEQQVSYRVDQGRVAHQGLTMMIGDVTIRTRGWVGFDQQIGLVAMIPIQDDWVAQQEWLVGLRGQTLEVPIHGTLQRPLLDRSALAGLTQQTVRGAAEGLLQQELQRQLNRILPVK